MSVFTRLPVTEVRLDGLPADTEVGAEAGYFVTSVFVTLPPGESVTMTLEMAGRLDVANGYDLSVRTPATVAPTPVQIDRDLAWRPTAPPTGSARPIAIRASRHSA